MKNISNNRGITLIALSISVFVIIVFAGIAIASVSYGREKIRTNTTEKTRIESVTKPQMETIDELQLLIANAIGEDGYDVNTAEKLLNKNREYIRRLEINPEQGSITVIYKGKDFIINKYGRVKAIEENN